MKDKIPYAVCFCICFSNFVCTLSALRLNMQRFLTVRNVEITSGEVVQPAASMIMCAFYCSMESTCCRSSYDIIARSCHMTPNCSAGLQMANSSIMIQKLDYADNDVCGHNAFNWVDEGLSCYFFSVQPSYWNLAQNECLARGGYLAEITTNDELFFVTNMVRFGMNTPFWLGATYNQQEGTWIWKTSKAIITVTDWDTYQPDTINGTQHCLRMQASMFKGPSGWDAFDCNATENYICEKPAYVYQQGNGDVGISIGRK